MAVSRSESRDFAPAGADEAMLGEVLHALRLLRLNSVCNENPSRVAGGGPISVANAEKHFSGLSQVVFKLF